MLVKVKTLMGKEFEVYVNPREKIKRIKRRIESKEGIPAEQQCLILAGRQVWANNPKNKIYLKKSFYYILKVSRQLFPR